MSGGDYFGGPYFGEPSATPTPSPSPVARISVTEFQVLSALRSFLLGALPLDPENVIKGQVNRVAEPIDEDFIVYWPIANPRLGTNVVTYDDNQAVASISGTVLTVTGVTRGLLSPGMLLVDEDGLLAVNTVVGQPLSGSASSGGTGTYAVLPSQTFVSGTVYGGVRKDLTPSDMTVQIDIHGPNATDYARIVESLFRSEYGTTAFTASGFDIAPLYCSEVRQMPFINQEQQYEYRWTLDAHLHVNPVVGTPQQFADELDIALISVPLFPSFEDGIFLSADDGGITLLTADGVTLLRGRAL